MKCSARKIEAFKQGSSRMKIGRHVTVRITGWPSTKPNRKTELVIQGIIVRIANDKVAVRRTRYEFAESDVPAMDGQA
jgi:hypothetical protein